MWARPIWFAWTTIWIKTCLSAPLAQLATGANAVNVTWVAPVDGDVMRVRSL